MMAAPGMAQFSRAASRHEAQRGAAKANPGFTMACRHRNGARHERVTPARRNANRSG